MGRPAIDLDAFYSLLAPFAARANGIASSEARELTGVPPSSFRAAAGKLIAVGRLFLMSHSSNTAYFLTPEACEIRRKDLIDGAVARRKERETAKNRARPKQIAVKLKPAKPVKVNPLVAFKAAQAIIPDDFKYTRAIPVPDMRYHVEDRPQVGGFLTEWMDLRRQA